MLKTVGTLLVFLILNGCSERSARKNFEIVQGNGVVAANGMVVSAHPQSSRIGIEVMQSGGNAVDAAVATEFALAVCYPEAGNLGGGGFMLIRTNSGETEVIDYREKAPLLSSRDMYLNDNGDVIDGLSTDSQLASGVPGTVDGLIRAQLRYGKLPFRNVIQPAIDLAEIGFPVTREQSLSLNYNRKRFIGRNRVWPAFVKDSLWKEGDTLVQKDLAGTLIRIRDEGREGFYSGETARLIVREMDRGNGIISLQDLKEYASVTRVPVTADYKGFKIISVPPPSGGGLILIQLLGMIEPFSIEKLGFHSAEAIHLMVEAERRAFADRSEYMGDPDYMNISADRLKDKKYLQDRMRSFNKDSASASDDIFPGSPEKYISEETTHYSVVDAEGNAVAVTTTLNGTFGSSIVVDGAGFLLNNEMDDFSVKPGFPNMYGLVGGEVNSVQPGKKMLSSMSPVIVEKDGELFMVAGSPGGSTIPTTVFQVITNVIDYGMNIQEAVDKGRFHHQWLPDYISYEKEAVDSLAFRKLNEMGHTLKLRSSLGRVNAIQILQNGEKCGGADKRGDNSACGY